MFQQRNILLLVLLGALPARAPADSAGDGPRESSPVEVEIFEKLPEDAWLDPESYTAIESYSEPAFAFVRIPGKYSHNALPLDRSTPFVLRATLAHRFPQGEHEVRLRARGASRLLLDGKTILATKPQQPNLSSHDPVPPPAPASPLPLRPLPSPHQEAVVSVHLDGEVHRFTLIAVIGGKKLAPTPGELSVSLGRPGEVPRLLGADDSPLLTDREWEGQALRARARHRQADRERRRELGVRVVAAWEAYHRRVREWIEARPAPSPPEVASGTPVRGDIDRFIGARLEAAGLAPTALSTDLEFLRRLALDVTGVVPTVQEIHRFLADPAPQRRTHAIDRLLAGPGWADHWVSYWQDVLAENPGILKPDLNNTGPFRWWLHQSFEDNIPIDRLVAELLSMEGSRVLGGPAGFAQASLNDAPMASKADVISQAFLAEKLSCARCHDAPLRPYGQKDLFALAAMLAGKTLELPASSTVRVPAGFRQPAVTVSLEAGDSIEPAWPFANLVQSAAVVAAMPRSGAVKSRGDVAALIVSPRNDRFARVLVNRVWKRYLGRGIAEPVDDFFDAQVSHPQLLDYLAREFVRSGHDLKRLARLILTSHVYARRPVAAGKNSREVRLFAGPARRRLSAEQVVDSLHVCSGKSIDSEPLNLNPAGNRPFRQFLDLGQPRRAWEFTALSNERDRPALALPRAQAVVDVLTSFGWRQSRQNPRTEREEAPSPLQALLLANGVLGTRIVRLSDTSAFTELCLRKDISPAALIEETFLRILTRRPSPGERRLFEELLEPAFANRRVEGARVREGGLQMDRRVSWSNHLSAEATLIRMEEERRLRHGEAPTARLKREFRERFEDMVWALINSPEFLLVP